MAKAQLCPVCGGSGQYYISPPEGRTSTVGFYETCHGCGGKGWVEVAEEQIYWPQAGGTDQG